MQLICKKCAYKWEYTGNKHRTSCSKCKTSITLPKYIVPSEARMQLTNPVIQIPIKLLDSLAFNRAKSWAKTNGEDYITLKSNSEGVLSL